MHRVPEKACPYLLGAGSPSGRALTIGRMQTFALHGTDMFRHLNNETGNSLPHPLQAECDQCRPSLASGPAQTGTAMALRIANEGRLERPCCRVSDLEERDTPATLIERRQHGDCPLLSIPRIRPLAYAPLSDNRRSPVFAAVAPTGVLRHCKGTCAGECIA